jgi:hypothetical protein
MKDVPQMNRSPRSRSRVVALLAAALLLATVAGLMTPASAAPRQEAEVGEPEALTVLPLINGWSNYGGGTGVAKVGLTNGIVRFKGAITTAGSNDTPFVLPPGMRPSDTVYVPVDLCNAANGRLIIEADGNVDVQAENEFGDAACFTSLEGASFALNPAGQVNIPLINGWTNSSFTSRTAKLAVVGGAVYFSGAIETAGSNKRPFVIPAALRPAGTVFVPIDLCGAADGRLRITPDGQVTVQADDSFSDAQCFTSLEGAHYVISPSNAGLLTLQNGWTAQPFHTRKPRATISNGFVHLSGAVSSGTSSTLFTLPVGMRPTKLVYIQADTCLAANARLIIQTNGTVEIDTEGAFSDAQCFTSLEGASFAR